MLRRLLALALVTAGSLSVAQSPNAQVSESPRQALIAMFTRDQKTFLNHLPPEVQALASADVPGTDFKGMVSEFADRAKSGDLETMDSGPILAVMHNTGSDIDRAEITIDEDFQGDIDVMQLGMQFFRKGKDEALPFLPDTLIVPSAEVRMRLENGVWRLVDVKFGGRIQLDDPDVLKKMSDQVKRSQEEENERVAAALLRTLNTAEVTYLSQYPQIGYACSLQALGPGGNNKPSPQHAGLIDAGAASGVRSGYAFAVVACMGTPADHYQIVALPSNPNGRTFCTDESAFIRYTMGSDAKGCLEGGQPL